MILFKLIVFLFSKLNKCFMGKKTTKVKTLKMFDHSTKMYVRVQLSHDKKHYEKWASKNKKDWKLINSTMSFDEVMLTQQELIDNNYKNLFKKIYDR